MKTLLVHLDRLTPVTCRIIARETTGGRGRPIPLATISERSGLNMKRVRWISRQDTWEKITVGEAERFMLACGITMQNFRKHLYYIRQTKTKSWPLAHLHKLHQSSRKSLLKILEQ